MKRTFLLGGYDLEMLEIRKLLEKSNEVFYDKKLRWGAKLSAYKDVLNDTHVFIGIELEEDIKVPLSYKVIDHHGEQMYKKSSLEQVAELLEIKLNRWQILVARNDARYIDGMKELFASDAEIQKVREADRKAQGVDAKDETLALESIRESNHKNIIKSQTEHFSAISDRVFGKFTQYIIYNDKKVLFYGYKIQKMIDFLNKNKVLDESYYFGGGKVGFLGIKEGFLSRKKIEKLVEDFVRCNNKTK